MTLSPFLSPPLSSPTRWVVRETVSVKRPSSSLPPSPFSLPLMEITIKAEGMVTPKEASPFLLFFFLPPLSVMLTTTKCVCSPFLSFFFPLLRPHPRRREGYEAFLSSSFFPSLLFFFRWRVLESKKRRSWATFFPPFPSFSPSLLLLFAQTCALRKWES